MSLALGIDAVDIKRFSHWHHYTHTTLNRIFSKHEINYCLMVPAKSAERFAARFAAKEAFFKALHHITQTPPPFSSIMRNVSVHRTTMGPHLEVCWENLELTPVYNVIVSITHTQFTAFAAVILEDKSMQKSSKEIDKC